MTWDDQADWDAYYAGLRRKEQRRKMSKATPIKRVRLPEDEAELPDKINEGPDWGR